MFRFFHCCWQKKTNTSNIGCRHSTVPVSVQNIWRAGSLRWPDTPDRMFLCSSSAEEMLSSSDPTHHTAASTLLRMNSHKCLHCMLNKNPLTLMGFGRCSAYITANLKALNLEKWGLYNPWFSPRTPAGSPPRYFRHRQQTCLSPAVHLSVSSVFLEWLGYSTDSQQ